MKIPQRATLKKSFKLFGKINPLQSGTNKDLFALWGRTPTDVYAVGVSGKILHYDGTLWSNQSNSGKNLNGIWGSLVTSDVYAVGDSGTILYSDGNTWTNQNSGTTYNLKSIWGSGLSDIYSVGDSGVILHKDGLAWKSISNSFQSNFNGVWGSSPIDLYLVGSNGIVVHSDGTTWQQVTGNWSKYENLSCVWGNSPTDVFVGTCERAVYQFDGTLWKTYSYWINGCHGLWGTSSTNGFVVGTNGSIAHFDGTVWNTMESGDGDRYFWPAAISGTSPTNVIAVGGMGMAENYDGSGWNSIISGFDFDWGVEDGFSGVWANSPTDAYVVSHDGIIGHYKDGSEWDFNSFTTRNFNGIWGNSSTGSLDIFAVGDSGIILEGDGNSWADISIDLSKNLYEVWGDTSRDDFGKLNNVFTVGDSGTILHYDGKNWTFMNSNTTHNLYGIWGSSLSDFFAVGQNGTIIHFDGVYWSPMNSTVHTDLYAVWGNSSQEVFAVGDSGTILHYDGTTWQPIISGTNQNLCGVWGSSATDVFVIGAGSTILHYEPPTIPRNPSPVTTAISPTSVALNSPDVMITVTGTNFIPTSSVRVNGSGRATTFIDSTRLTAIISADDLLSAGTYSITVYNPNTISGDGVSNPQVFTIPKAATSLSVTSVFGLYGDKTVTLTATLKLTSGEYLPVGKPVSFSLNGIQVGTAYASFMHPATLEKVSLGGIGAGTHSGCITAGFAGDENYLACNGSGDLTLRNAETILEVYPATGRFGGTVTLGARLTSNNVPLSGKSLVFSFNGVRTGTAITDNYGRVLLTGVSLSGISSGNHPNIITAYFDGDENYSSSKGSANLMVNSLRTSISCPNKIVYYPGNSFSLTATVSASGKNINEGYVEFIVTSRFYFVNRPNNKAFLRRIVLNKKVNVTDGKVGYDSYVSLGIGTYDVKAVYAGSQNFAACSTVSIITVRELTSAEIGRLARQYAPMVYLHPLEKYMPMDADVFIKNSSLNWSHENASYDCPDIIPKGAIDPYKLGKGGYSHKVKKFKIRPKWKVWETDVGFKHSGRKITCSEFCAPHQGVAGNEGFFLNLHNDERKGNAALNSPVYYEFSSGNYITYWFLYGFNEPPVISGDDVSIRPNMDWDGHECDWEGICILLDKNNEPVSVNLFAHGNSPKNISWNNMKKVYGDHPVIYSALGSHASYSNQGYHEIPWWQLVGIQVNWIFYDNTVQGRGWQTWNNCKNAVDQPWYGYGGGWGEVNEKYKVPFTDFGVDLAAPVGPGHKDQKTGASR